jgi:zinc transporter ZupT
LTSQGYFQRNPKKIKLTYATPAMGLVFVAALLGTTLAVKSNPLAGILIGVSAAGVIILIFSYIMPALTDKGVETRDWLSGLKDYIKMAEADRLKYLQSPDGARLVQRQLDKL